MMHPLESSNGRVCVLMAAYNHQAFVTEAIQSVREQTFTDWRLLIVDDASSDLTVEKIRAFQDTRIQLLASKTTNQGQFSALNQTILQAFLNPACEYLAVLNSDDAFLPEKLAEQVTFLDQHADVAAVFTDVELINEQSKAFVSSKQATGHSHEHTHGHTHVGLFSPPYPETRFEWLRQFFEGGNRLCHPSVLIRRSVHEALGLYDPRFANLADLAFWLQLCLKHQIAVLPQKLTRFRILEDQGNMGARKPSSIRRIAWEKAELLKHYNTLPSWTELNQVFPGLQERLGLSPQAPKELIPYAIAQHALAQNTVAHRFFALKTLFEAMANPTWADLALMHAGFGYPQLIALTGKIDPFQLEAQQTFAQLKKHPLLKLIKPLIRPL